MSSCSDSHSRELCTKLQSHIDILEYAIVRLSGKAELCGAAQQVLVISIILPIDICSMKMLNQWCILLETILHFVHLLVYIVLIPAVLYFNCLIIMTMLVITTAP